MREFTFVFNRLLFFTIINKIIKESQHNTRQNQKRQFLDPSLLGARRHEVDPSASMLNKSYRAPLTTISITSISK